MTPLSNPAIVLRKQSAYLLRSTEKIGMAYRTARQRTDGEGSTTQSQATHLFQ